jgi:crossover junction endodeoxyribonuclease RusA
MREGGILKIELSWPAEQLSPNGRAHHMVVARFKKAAKIEAGWATKYVRPFAWAPPEGKIPVHLIAHPKPTGPHPDADNLVASVKSHLDGIAEALGVNDRDFDAPTIEWADRCQRGKLIVCIGERE